MNLLMVFTSSPTNKISDLKFEISNFGLLHPRHYAYGRQNVLKNLAAK
jgi:hypothetical protein